MSLFSLLSFITSHPLNKKNKLNAAIRFVKWQINTRLNPYPIIYQFTEKSKLIVQKGMTGATGNLYCGLHEYNDMGFLLHFLRKEDLFIDIGANVGTYTILASGHIGAKTFSFEPVPQTFLNLSSNVKINNINDSVKLHNIAIGSEFGSINFTSSHDTMNHVANDDEPDTIKVTVKPLDAVLKDEQVPVLLKIDVEGFETEVIKGASETLKQLALKAIIIELNGSGLRYGYKENEIHEKLLMLQFKPYQYNPTNRSLIEVVGFGSHNTIYIRDFNFVKNRLISADKFKIFNMDI